MIRVHPLRALVARAGRAAKITAPQYDSVPADQRRRFAERHPDCSSTSHCPPRISPRPVPIRRRWRNGPPGIGGE